MVLSHPVLILEDAPEVGDLVRLFCRNVGFESVLVSHGQEALDLLDKQTFSLFVVDLNMPVMDGRTFIAKLKEKIDQPVVLVQTAENTPQEIIDVMKLGVYDYVFKPIDGRIFQKKLVEAAEYLHLKELEKNLSLNASKKLRGQLEWINYKELKKNAGDGSTDRNAVYHLKTSLGQGAGFGAVLPLVDMLDSRKKDLGDEYGVNKKVFDRLVENNHTCRQMLEGVIKTSDILDREFELEQNRSGKIIEDLPEIIKDIKPFLEKKGTTVSFPKPGQEYLLRFHKENLYLIIEELVLNAYKYCRKKTPINIFTYVSEGYYCLTVKNQVDPEPYGGVPPDYEKLVLEPFFRIYPPYEETNSIEKIGMGLGLTVVDNIIRKHRGQFQIYDVKDHTTGAGITHAVIAEMMLPLEI